MTTAGQLKNVKLAGEAYREFIADDRNAQRLRALFLFTAMVTKEEIGGHKVRWWHFRRKKKLREIGEAWAALAQGV